MCFSTIYQLNSVFRQIKMSYQRVSSSIRFCIFTFCLYSSLSSLSISLSLLRFLARNPLQCVCVCALDVVVFSSLCLLSTIILYSLASFQVWISVRLRKCVEYLECLHSPPASLFAPFVAENEATKWHVKFAFWPHQQLKMYIHCVCVCVCSVLMYVNAVAVPILSIFVADSEVPSTIQIHTPIIVCYHLTGK